MAKLIGYARVSTDEQDLTLQRRALEDFGVEPRNIFEEHASGGTMNRRQLEFALARCAPGDTLVVWKLDRLGRSLTGLVSTVQLLKKYEVEFVAIRDNIETRTPAGRLFFHIMAALAEFERDLISERTKAGMRVAKERGAQFGQPHSITGFAKRLEVARQIVEEGVENITAREAVARLNKADPKLRKIKSLETWRRWVREGCKGLE